MSLSYTPVVDMPWKSQWRIDLERRRSERPVVYTKSKPQKEPRVKKERIPRPRRIRVERFCGCGSKLSTRARGELCRVCIGATKRKPKPGPRFCVTGCGKTLRSHNKSEYCKKCYNRERRRIHSTPRPNCLGCGKTINRNNTVGKCRKCSRSHYQKTWRDKQ